MTDVSVTPSPLAVVAVVKRPTTKRYLQWVSRGPRPQWPDPIVAAWEIIHSRESQT